MHWYVILDVIVIVVVVIIIFNNDTIIKIVVDDVAIDIICESNNIPNCRN